MGRTPRKETTVQTETEIVDADNVLTVTEPVADAHVDFEQPQELNLEQQVTVRSIAGWIVGFARLTSIGDVTIPKRGAIRLTRNEIISQVQNGNRLFTGVDGLGSHATLYIDDELTRKEVGFDDINGAGKQDVFTDETVKRLFTTKSIKSFEENVRDSIRTRAEKYALMVSIIRLGLNDYDKIQFSEKYTGFKLDRVREDEQNLR